MPVTIGLLALGATVLFPDLSWAEAFLLAAILSVSYTHLTLPTIYSV